MKVIMSEKNLFLTELEEWKSNHIDIMEEMTRIIISSGASDITPFTVSFGVAVIESLTSCKNKLSPFPCDMSYYEIKKDDSLCIEGTYKSLYA
jgi:hypothetical protein